MARGILISILVGGALLLGYLPALLRPVKQWKLLAQLVVWVGVVLLLLSWTSARLPR